MQSVSVIGIGRLGGALAVALSRAGYRIQNLVYRSSPVSKGIVDRISPTPNLISFDDLKTLNSDIIFITSADPEITTISSDIASKLIAGSVVFHASGSLSSEILSDAADAGCGIASIHPLVSISDPVRGSESFAGAFFCLEGKDWAEAVARELVRRLGGEHFRIETRFKALYHASAVTASGHVVALIDIAIEMLSKCGLKPPEAKGVLMPLIRSTVENVAKQGNEKALTGTFARADIEAFDRHMQAFENYVSDAVQRIYLELGRRSLDLAELDGQDLESTRVLRDRILLALRTGKVIK